MVKMTYFHHFFGTIDGVLDWNACFHETQLTNRILHRYYLIIYERIKQISEVLVSLVHMTPLLKGTKVYMFLRFFYIYTCLNWSLHFFDNSLQISLLKPFLWVILITSKSKEYKYETLTWLDFSPAVQDCPKCPPPVFPASPGVSVCWLGYKCTSYSAKITWWIIQKTDPLKGFQSFKG